MIDLTFSCRCDRILSHGTGLRQLSYSMVEARLSDHRPVIARFIAEVESSSTSGRKLSTVRSRLSNDAKVSVEELLPTKSFKIRTVHNNEVKTCSKITSLHFPRQFIDRPSIQILTVLIHVQHLADFHSLESCRISTEPDPQDNTKLYYFSMQFRSLHVQKNAQLDYSASSQWTPYNTVQHHPRYVHSFISSLIFMQKSGTSQNVN